MQCRSTSGSGYTFPSCSYAPCRSDDSAARRNRTRTERQRRAAQLSSAQLSSAQLSSAQLSAAQRSAAQRSSAQLSSAQLSSAQLSSAQLSSALAQLSSAQRWLSSAQLSSALDRHEAHVSTSVRPRLSVRTSGMQHRVLKVVKGTTRYSASTRRISVGMSTICDSTNDCHSASVSCKQTNHCAQCTNQLRECSAMAVIQCACLQQCLSQHRSTALHIAAVPM
jgi:hypothetical protein